MGRSGHLRHRRGERGGGRRRGRRHLPGARRVRAGARPHPGRSRRGRPPRARHHHRLLVRQEIPARAGGRAPRLGRDTRGSPRPGPPGGGPAPPLPPPRPPPPRPPFPPPPPCPLSPAPPPP